MRTILENAKRLYRLKHDQTLPIYNRYLLQEIKNSTAKIVGVYGARGVGKTTLLLQMLRDLELERSKKLYISWDHPIFKNISLFDFVRFWSLS